MEIKIMEIIGFIAMLSLPYIFGIVCFGLELGIMLASAFDIVLCVGCVIINILEK